MRAQQPVRPDEGRGTSSRVWAALLVVAVAAACAGENLFTGPSSGALTLVGPDVSITAPQPGIDIAPADSVEVTANVVSGEGVAEVIYSGILAATGAAAFTPVTAVLAGPTDTTVSRFLKRSGATPGDARIIVEARDLTGDRGADTVAVTLAP